MDRETLRLLELLNQLSLTAEEKEATIAFFADRAQDAKKLCDIPTEDVERMVHVMPIMTVVREDEVIKRFERDDLQNSAPDTEEGYWCVPRVVE